MRSTDAVLQVLTTGTRADALELLAELADASWLNDSADLAEVRFYIRCELADGITPADVVPLPAVASPEIVAEWLRVMCHQIGTGFHPDSNADNYSLIGGELLPVSVATVINDGVDRAFELLGDEVYEICEAEIDQIEPDLVDDETRAYGPGGAPARFKNDYR